MRDGSATSEFDSCREHTTRNATREVGDIVTGFAKGTRIRAETLEFVHNETDWLRVESSRPATGIVMDEMFR